MYTAVMPNGERLRFEPWVVRRWREHREGERFFCPLIKADLDRAVRLIRRHAGC